MPKKNLIRLCAIAALFGGAMWIVKGGLILLNVVDLGWMVIASQALMGMGVIGLYTKLGDQAGRFGKIGFVLAITAICLATVNTVSDVIDQGPFKPTIFNVTYMIGILSLLCSLIFIGSRANRLMIRPAALRLLPVGLGLLTFPIIGLGALIHLELGIVVLGFVWMWMGWLIWKSADT